MHFCTKCGNMYYLKLKNMEDNSSSNLFIIVENVEMKMKIF